MQQHSQDPNFKFCTFCKGDSNRQDNLRFTHWLMDKETREITCPFLLRTICQVCYEYGHTSKNCKNHYKLDELQMDAMAMDDTTGKSKLAQIRLEDELFRRRLMQSVITEPKHCMFCASGKYKDNFYKTHYMHECPRLACMTCTYCNHMGHTVTKCPDKKLDEMPPGSVAGQFVFDFDEENEVAN